MDGNEHERGKMLALFFGSGSDTDQDRYFDKWAKRCGCCCEQLTQRQLETDEELKRIPREVNFPFFPFDFFILRDEESGLAAFGNWLPDPSGNDLDIMRELAAELDGLKTERFRNLDARANLFNAKRLDGKREIKFFGTDAPRLAYK